MRDGDGVFKPKQTDRWYSWVVFRDETIRMAWGTDNKKLARRMKDMWDALAGQREWDVLQCVVNREVLVGVLYDQWIQSEKKVETLRQRQRDVDLSQYLDDFLRDYRASGVKPDTADHVEVHVRWLLSSQTAFQSKLTPAYLQTRLSSYNGTASTRRKVHSSWSVFFAHLTRTGIISTSPMTDVPRATIQRQPVRFYELSDVKRILEKAPTPEMKSLWAFLYGTGADLSAAISTRKGDWDLGSRTVRVAGTKTATRDRVCRVADWAWDIITDVVGASMPPAWDGTSRWYASKGHRSSVQLVTPRIAEYPLRYARHHWAATRLRSGWPIKLVQQQLGHSSPTLTLQIYGAFIPSGHDYAYWEGRLTDGVPREDPATPAS